VSELRTEGLYKSFGPTEVLRGVTLDVPSGSLTAILGKSGSGKTTLLRLLAGFERADAGTITIGGVTVDDGRTYVAPEHRRIGYVPQDGSLFPHLTIAANVAFGLPRRDRARAVELLDAVGLGDMRKRYPHQLSGGQQQRVALARALAIEPAVVLLDEPFASLDAGLRASVRADVQRIFREAGTTAILVTHDQDEALSIADRVAVLRDGRIAQYAPPEDLYTRPVDPELARFVGDANLLDGVLADRQVSTVLGPLELNEVVPLPSTPLTVLVRPEQIAITPAVNGDGPRGEVIAYGYHGHDAVVHVALGSEIVTVRVLTGERLPVGAEVALHAHGPVVAWPK
jgi:iron(III) transport system ATP-binding protein